MSRIREPQDVTTAAGTSQDTSSSKFVDRPTRLAMPTEMRFIPWLDSLPMIEYESQEQRLHDEIVAYLRYIGPTAAEVEARRRVTEKIGELVRCRFWTCEIKTFGSVAQNLYLPAGDIDLTVSTPQVYNDYSKKKGLFDLSRMLKEAAMSHNAFVVTGAKVPILTFSTVDNIGPFKFDISINGDDGLRAIPMIKEYIDTLPVLRPLMLVLKSYLASQKLNSAATGGLGSFVLMCMVISFIQTNPHNRPKDYLEKPMEAESLGFLLMDFFQYYSREFPYQTSYISVLRGGIFPKESKEWVREAHPEALAIESPLDPERDVARPCQKIGQVRAAFGAAYDALASVHSDATSGNILGSIITMSEEILEHRVHIQKIVESGTLVKDLRGITLPPSWENLGSRPQHHGRSEGFRATSYGYHTGSPEPQRRRDWRDYDRRSGRPSRDRRSERDDYRDSHYHPYSSSRYRR